jgi:thymidylate synthase (FAD)
MIRVYPLGQTQLMLSNVERWLKTEYQTSVGEVLGRMRGGQALAILAGKRCYKSFKPGLNKNINKIRRNLADYVTNILKSGHGSVLEHASYTFAIEGVTRVFTGEMNRHRAGVAISEGSMRYIRDKDGFKFWSPDSLRVYDSDRPKVRSQKRQTLQLFEEVFRKINGYYVTLEQLWEIDNLKDFGEKKRLTSMFRRIVPMGVATGGLWTFNLRAMRHVLTMRCSPAAEEEIQHVCFLILKEMHKLAPLIFKDFDSCGQPEFVKV